MSKESLITILDKILETIEKYDAENLPNDIRYELSYNHKSVYKICLNLKRSEITVWEGSENLGAIFKVGIHSVNWSIKKPFYLARVFCPLWRKWLKIKKITLRLHNNIEQINKDKELLKHKEIFYNLYYSQFSDDIDNIFLDDLDK